MKQHLRPTKSFIFSLSLLAFVIVSGVILTEFRKASPVSAGPSHNFTGFAWSDMPTTSDQVINPTGLTVGRGAGWISFNSSDTASSVDYGVNVDASGNITGNAWSENVGWISFNTPSTGCPHGSTLPFDYTCSPKINLATGTFSGFARATAYADPQSGGWDGWISLGQNGWSGPAYGVTVSPTTGTGNVSGYAWGGDVLGWINFTGVQIAFLPTVSSLTLTANPPCSTSTDLIYASPAGTAFTSCTMTSTPSTGVNGDTMPADYPLPTVSNQIITGVALTAPSTTFTLTCMGTAIPTATATATATLCTPQPAVTLTGPSCVQSAGTAAQLSWSSSNVTNCSINQGVGTVPTNGSQPVSVGGPSTTYTITCTGMYPTVTSSHTITVTPNCVQTGGPGGPITPIFEEV